MPHAPAFTLLGIYPKFILRGRKKGTQILLAVLCVMFLSGNDLIMFKGRKQQTGMEGGWGGKRERGRKVGCGDKLASGQNYEKQLASLNSRWSKHNIYRVMM